MAKLNLIETIQTKLSTLTKKDGQLIIIRDNASLYVDLDGARIYISDWIDISTDEERLAMLTPLNNKYYYVVSTNKIWRYISGSWVQVTLHNASDILYDNTTSGLNATNINSAIDEVVGNVKKLNTDTGTLTSSLKKVQTDILSLQTSVNTNLESIEQNQTDIVLIQNDVEMLLSAQDITATTSTTQPNSYAGREHILEIGGVTEQESTAGNQLFDANWLPTKTQNNITVTNNGDGSFTLSGGVNNDFVLSYEIKHKDFVKLFKAGKIYAKAETNTMPYFYINKIVDGQNYSLLDLRTSNFAEAEITQDMLDDESAYLIMGFYGYASGTFKGGTIKPMVYQDGDGTWEKFSGGQPAPNPSYPMEIKTYKGKNLLDCRGLTEQTINGVTFTPVYDANGNLEYINANGTATNQAVFTISKLLSLPTEKMVLTGSLGGSANSTYCLVVSYYDNNLNWKNESYQTNGGGLLISSGYSKYQVAIVVRIGVSINNVKFYPMIRKATIADPTYVPYGCLRIKTHGKNLLDMSNAKGNISASITVKMNADGSYSYVGTATDKAVNVWLLGNWGLTEELFTIPKGTYFIKGVNLYNNTTTILASGRDGKVVTFNEDKVVTGVRAVDAVSGTTYNETHYPIIVESDTEVDWEPYTESSAILSQPIELYGIGDVQDILTPKEIGRKYGVKVFDGTETISLSQVSGGHYFYLRVDDNGGIKRPIDNASKIGAYCTRLIEKTPNALWNAVADGFAIDAGNGQNIRCRFTSIPEITSAETLQAKLAEWYAEGKPMVLVYPLAEETTEALPTADQIALNSLQTYDGTTHVGFDSEIQPTFKAEYGTSKVGGIALQACAEGCIAELTSSVTGNEMSEDDIEIIWNEVF